MNYVYDILVNFNENFYEFYDWNLKDNILHIRRIPTFKIDSYKFSEIKNNVVKFDTEFLDIVKNKAEFFQGRSVKVLKYAFLLTDGLDIIGVNVSDKIKYTSLQIDEELDILETMHFKEYDIKYEVIKKKNLVLKTRYKIEQEKKIKEKLDSLLKENNVSKIKYLYYECFNKKENKISNILEVLNNSLEDRVIFEKLSSFFELHEQIN